MLRTPKHTTLTSGPQTSLQKLVEEHKAEVQNPHPLYSYQFVHIPESADLATARSLLTPAKTVLDPRFEEATFGARMNLARSKGWSEGPDFVERAAMTLSPGRKNPCALYALGRRERVMYRGKPYLVPAYFWQERCVEESPDVPEEQKSPV